MLAGNGVFYGRIQTMPENDKSLDDYLDGLYIYLKTNEPDSVDYIHSYMSSLIERKGKIETGLSGAREKLNAAGLYHSKIQ